MTDIDSDIQWVICYGTHATYFIELPLYMVLIDWRRDNMTNFN